MKLSVSELWKKKKQTRRTYKGLLIIVIDNLMTYGESKAYYR